jgi:hypothetical protein
LLINDGYSCHISQYNPYIRRGYKGYHFIEKAIESFLSKTENQNVSIRVQKNYGGWEKADIY